MTTTTYYNLNIVEGTDIVNPLIVDNPNYEKIDETMHNNAVAGVTLATEIANATVHAITRENSDCAVIRFIATSAWKAGDTATVDGVPVTALLPSGETLPDGAYVINSNVLCILTGTNLTVYAERKKTDDASEIAYNGTNVSMELNKINSNLTEKITETILSASHHPYGGYEFERIGTICQVSLTSTNGILPNETVYLGTISKPKLLPNKNIYHRVYSQNGECLCLITIEKSGNVSIYTYGGNASVTHNIEETFTYIPK